MSLAKNTFYFSKTSARLAVSRIFPAIYISIKRDTNTQSCHFTICLMLRSVATPKTWKETPIPKRCTSHLVQFSGVMSMWWKFSMGLVFALFLGSVAVASRFQTVHEERKDLRRLL